VSERSSAGSLHSFRSTSIRMCSTVRESLCTMQLSSL
jgi:hypothetical protein